MIECFLVIFRYLLSQLFFKVIHWANTLIQVFFGFFNNKKYENTLIKIF